MLSVGLWNWWNWSVCPRTSIHNKRSKYKYKEVTKMFEKAKRFMRDTAGAFVSDQSGAALWEYALLVVVGLGVAAALMALRAQIIEVFSQATAELSW